MPTPVAEKLDWKACHCPLSSILLRGGDVSAWGWTVS